MGKPFLFLLLVTCMALPYQLLGQSCDPCKKKASATLQDLLSSSSRSIDSVSIMLSVKKTVDKDKAMGNGRIVYQYAPAGALIVRIALPDIAALLSEPHIIFADLLRQPVEEITTGAFDLSANRINTARRLFPADSGQGTLVSVKEQAFDTSDIDLKNRWVNTGMAATTYTAHAVIMATMIGGAGNSSPYGKGAAPASRLTSSSFITLLPDPDSVYRKYGISVQNHSYGVGIENYYGADAVAYDKSVHLNPSLLHVFSAGNIGGNTSAAGPYAGIPGWANLSGSFKMAKNVMTVGAIDSMYQVMSASSKGPAHDGRVKPELVAFGEDGSSGAAALVSGTALLLQQAYKKYHNDSLPIAALIRAALINSADDIGNAQVDYSSGFGNLNAFKALKTIHDQRYWQGVVTPGQTIQYTIPVPANAAQLKVTLVWTDTAAAVNVPKALVNDLDMTVKNISTGVSWLPWVLNPSAHKDSLSLPATRKKDTLNTIEQVTIPLPAPGNYQVEIKASHQAGSQQAFAIAYQVDSLDYFQWTYPEVNSPLKSASRVFLRWNTNRTGMATLQYLNGNDWQNISAAVDLSKEYFTWNTPSMPGITQLKMLMNNGDFYLSDSLVIAGRMDLEVGFNCEDSFMLYWNDVGADSYELYKLGTYYLEPFLNTTDSFVVLQKNNFPGLYYTVAPLFSNYEGLKAATKNYTLQGVECYFRNFLVQLIQQQTLLTTQLGTLNGVQQVVFLKQVGNSFIPLQTQIPTNNNPQYTDIALSPGVNTYKVMLVLTNGQQLYSEPQSIYYFPANPVILYPNPVSQGSTLKIIAADFDEYSISIFDATGRLVWEQWMVNNYLEVAPLKLSKGLYMVRIRNRDMRAFTEKLLVQ